MGNAKQKTDTRSTVKTNKAKAKPPVAKPYKPSATISAVELVLVWLAKMFKASAEDYCEIETVDGHYNLVLQNGALVTLLRYDGIRSTIDYNEIFLGQIDRLNSYLRNPFKTVGHKLMWVFRRDLDGNAGIDRIIEIQKKNGKYTWFELELIY